MRPVRGILFPQTRPRQSQFGPVARNSSSLLPPLLLVKRVNADTITPNGLVACESLCFPSVMPMGRFGRTDQFARMETVNTSLNYLAALVISAKWRFGRTAACWALCG